jgi:hypothetical protein
MRNLARKLFRTPPTEDPTPIAKEGYGWQVPTTATPHNAASIPITMRIWTADPVADRGLFEEQRPTTMMPRIEAPTAPPRYAAAAEVLGNSYNDVAFKCNAAKALLLGSDVNVVLAGIQAYVERNPVMA